MTERSSTRRQFMLVGTGALAGLAGCSGVDDSPTPGGTTSPTSTGATTPTHTASPTDELTDESTQTPDGETPTETEEGPGGKNYHWHGRLFFEVNGELVDFRQPKYYYKNIKDENPDVVYFHFHEDPEEHGPNEWSNEKEVITLARGLNLLPDIGYKQRGGEPIVTFDGETYDARQSGTSITVHEGTRLIDPTSYEVQHDDDFWVQVTTDDAQRNVSPAHSGAELGTLIFDINNLRVDFSREKYLGADASSGSFHFHDDDHPYLWYMEEQVTLAEALNALPGIGYKRSNGNHVVEYEDEENVSHSRTFDGGSSPHEITVRERTSDIDPRSHELRAGDIVWIYVESNVVPDNEH